MNDPENPGGPRNTIYKQATRSSRRMTPLRRFAYRCIVPYRPRADRNLLAQLPDRQGDRRRASRCRAGQGAVDHSLLLASAPVVLHQMAIRRQRLKIGFLISPSVDGEIGGHAGAVRGWLCDPRLVDRDRRARRCATTTMRSPSRACRRSLPLTGRADRALSSSPARSCCRR